MTKKLLIVANVLIVFGFIGALTAFAQVPDTTPPVISSVATSGITQTGATVSWTTDEPADGQTEYGTSTTYGLLSALSTATTTTHSIAISSLTASTTYHYLVRSRDGAGNLATSSDYSFLTLAPVATTTTPVATTTVAVRVKVEPRTLNTRSNGKWIEAEVAFPRGYDASQIDTASIKLNGVIAPVKVKVKKMKWYESFNDRKTAKVEMKFSRADVINLLSIDTTATSTASTATSTASTLPLFSFVTKEITISGNVGTDTFGGTTTVRVLVNNSALISAMKEKKNEEHREEKEQQKETRRGEHSFGAPIATSSASGMTTTNATTTFFEKEEQRKEGKNFGKGMKKEEGKKNDRR